MPTAIARRDFGHLVPGTKRLDRKHRYRIEDVGGEASILFLHKGRDRVWCAGRVMLEGDKARHTMTSEQPLTINESLLCVLCGEHGHVARGRWFPIRK